MPEGIGYGQQGMQPMQGLANAYRGATPGVAGPAQMDLATMLGMQQGGTQPGMGTPGGMDQLMIAYQQAMQQQQIQQQMNLQQRQFGAGPPPGGRFARPPVSRTVPGGV